MEKIDITNCTLPTEVAKSIAMDFEIWTLNFPNDGPKDCYQSLLDDIEDSEGDDVYDYTIDDLDTFVAEVFNNFAD